MKPLARATFLGALAACDGVGVGLSAEALHDLPYFGFAISDPVSALQLDAKVVKRASAGKAASRTPDGEALLIPPVNAPPAGSAPAARKAHPGGAVAAVAQSVRVVAKAKQYPEKSIKDHAIEAGRRSLRYQMAVPGSHETGHRKAPHSMESFFMWSFWDVVVFISIWSIAVILCAYWYDKNKVPPPLSGKTPVLVTGELDGDWKFHLFDCCATPDICCWTVCCPGVRWGNTLRMAGFSRFWVAVLLFTSLWMFSSVFGVVFLWILAAVGAWYRQRIRMLFKMENGTLGTIGLDFLAYCCCPWCSIVQEARTMEEAYASKHHAVARPQAMYMASFSTAQPPERPV